MKITVDLNVLLGVAQNRLPHYAASEEVLHRARLGEYTAVLPGHALTTLHYIIEKYSSTTTANETIDGLLADFAVHPMDKTNFLRARQLPLKDFEDAVVAVVAETTGSQYIVTRNVADFAGQMFPLSLPLTFWKNLPASKRIEVQRAESGPIFNFQSLIKNYKRRCGLGFWLCARRRGGRIPNAGCNDRANAAHGQKNRRPEGCRAKVRLASLLLSQRPIKGILLRRALPSSLLPDNSTTRSF